MYFISKLTKRFLVLSAINFLLIHNIFSDERKLLILGDSISAGYGIEEGSQWTEILQIKYNEQKTELVIINASISGDTTGGGLSRIESLLNKYNPEILLIELGGNDALRGYPVKKIKSNLDKISSLAIEKKVEVLLMQIRIPPNYGRRYVSAFENLFVEMGTQEGINLFPFMLQTVALNKDLMLPDGIHPNAKAQPLIAEFMYNKLQRYVKD
jgi:acyl-CoA thioesterase-1|tara:strand:- start:19 stop:654 length:636 start_codon:yes stop_codon:yes gene_type:complete